jgi:H+-transporting ATPase
LLLLIVGLLTTGHALLTPLLMVLLMVIGDFLAMSLTTDNVHSSPTPNVWRIGRLTIAGIIMGLCMLAFCLGVLAAGLFELRLGPEALQTLAFLTIVFGGQATLYAIRQRRHLWGSRPTVWMLSASAADIAIGAGLAVTGIAMTPLPVPVIAMTFGAAVVFGLVLDLFKIPVFASLGIV